MERVKLHLDTHVLIWLYAGRTDLFSPTAKNWLEKSDLLISPVIALELQYLFEVGKIMIRSQDVISDLESRTGLSFCKTGGFHDVISVALELSWTRDPFDRMIVAQAKLERARLLTKDRSLHQHYPRALW